MHGLVPGIHVFLGETQAWMAATSAAMTENSDQVTGKCATYRRQ